MFGLTYRGVCWYLVFVPALDKIVVSVHVVFNEIIPDPSAEYFSELERLKIEVA